MSRHRIRIGTSGWSYASWRGRFYPEDLPEDEWLAFYARHFHSVEINSSFYRLPSRETLQRWYQATPNDFLFSVKASRYVTHLKKLADPHSSLPALLNRLARLGEKLGPILFQLPPHWHRNTPRLRTFLEALSEEFDYAFEFRDPDWIDEEVLDLLRQHRTAFCIYDLAHFQPPAEITAAFVYVRLHGPGEPYRGSYDTSALIGWADTFSSWTARGYPIYCYFDNDEHAYAAHNAASLQAMLKAVS